MRNVTSILAMICLISGLLACSEDTNPAVVGDFYEVYGGKPFKGESRAVIELEEGGQQQVFDGDGRIALIDQVADSVSLIFMADFDSAGEVNLQVRGRYDEKNYVMETEDPDVFFLVEAGHISGKSDNATQTMIFDGTMEHEQVYVTVEVLFKQAVSPFPAGSSLHLTFDTRRKIEEGESGGTGCQMKMVPVWGPYGMTMGMVPDC